MGQNNDQRLSYSKSEFYNKNTISLKITVTSTKGSG